MRDKEATELALRAFDYVERLARVDRLQDLSATLRRAVEPLGLTGIACGVAAGPKLAAGRRFFFLDWPADWIALYEAENFVAIDPVPRLVRTTHRAATLSAMVGALPARDPGRRVIEAGTDFHFTEGILVPGNLSDGSAGVVSLAGDRDPLSRPEQAFIEIVAAATLHRAEVIDGPTVATDCPALTRRELDCLALLVRGSGDREIAAKLAITEPTVRFHLDSARRKTGATSRTHLAALAIWLGLARL